MDYQKALVNRLKYKQRLIPIILRRLSLLMNLKVSLVFNAISWCMQL